MPPPVPSKYVENVTAFYISPPEGAGNLENYKEVTLQWIGKNHSCTKNKEDLRKWMSNIDVLFCFKYPSVKTSFRNGLWKKQRQKWLHVRQMGILYLNSTQNIQDLVCILILSTHHMQAISNANFKTFCILLMKYLKNTWFHNHI